MGIGHVLNELLKEDKRFIHIDVGFGPEGFFDINKSVVISFGVVVFFFLLCLFLTSGMKTHNIGRRQLVAEMTVTGLRNLIGGILGHNAKQYTDLMASVFLFIAGCNLVGLFGYVPPTMDLNVTIALAGFAIVLIEFAAIRYHGILKFPLTFTRPTPVITPLNILELGIRPLALCMRLFGNILGATVIMELLKHVVPVGIPALASIYFDLFDGCIQAYVFVFLTSLFIAEATE